MQFPNPIKQFFLKGEFETRTSKYKIEISKGKYKY